MNQQRFDVLLDSVSRLTRRGAVAHALNIVEKLRPVEVSDILRNLPEREREVTFSALCQRDAAKAAEALSELGPEYVLELLAPLPVAQILPLLDEISSDDAAPIIAELPEEVRDALLASMQAKASSDVQELLTFETETAGRIMTPDFFALGEDVTVSEAIAALQRRSEEFEMSFYVYVVDERNHLLGVISLRQLLLNTPSTPLKKIMSMDPVKVTTSTDQEEVARLVAFYNLIALPVVDEENKLVGIVTVDDVIDVMREEATEDIYALAGVEPDDRALGSSVYSIRRRLPWLLTTLAASLLASAIVNIFRDVLQSTIALAVLIPVILMIGSNAATQTMTVIVRGIGLNEVTPDRGLRVLVKEGTVGLVGGAIVGAVAAATVWLWFRSLVLAVAVGIALMLNMLVACVAGTLIPVLLKRVRVDPAIASSVFVITLTIVAGLLLYLAIGRAMLH